MEEPKTRRKTLADLQFPSPPGPVERPRLPPLTRPDLEPDPELGLDRRNDDSGASDQDATESGVERARAQLRVVEDPPDDETDLDETDLDETDLDEGLAEEELDDEDLLDVDELLDAPGAPPRSRPSRNRPAGSEADDEPFDELDPGDDPALAPPPGYRTRD